MTHRLQGGTRLRPAPAAGSSAWQPSRRLLRDLSRKSIAPSSRLSRAAPFPTRPAPPASHAPWRPTRSRSSSSAAAAPAAVRRRQCRSNRPTKPCRCPKHPACPCGRLQACWTPGSGRRIGASPSPRSRSARRNAAAANRCRSDYRGIHTAGEPGWRARRPPETGKPAVCSLRFPRRFAQCHGDFPGGAVPVNGESERVPAAFAVQDALQRFLARHRFAFHRDNQIAANAQLKSRTSDKVGR